MKCHEFSEHLPEYLDGSLDNRLRGVARRHVETCAHCRLLLQRSQALGRTVQHALEHSTAGLSIPPALSQRILRAARAEEAARPAATSPWQWLRANPFRALGFGVAAGAILLLALQLRPRHKATAEATSGEMAGYSIDVPLQFETRVFRLQNGTVIDAVITGVAWSHAHFPHPTPRSPARP